MKLLTVKETSNILRITTQRLYAMAREGAIPSVRIGKCVRFDAERLHEWIRQGGSLSLINSNGAQHSGASK